MPVVRSYNIPEVESRPAPNAYPQVAAAGDASLFGGNQARDMQVAGANLERTSDNLGNMALRMFKEANDTKVDADMNSFIDQKQKALVGFSQLRGQDAIQGAQGVTDSLLTTKRQLLDGAKNAYQRDALAKRLDAHILDATGSITSHVGAESRTWQITTKTAQADLLNRQGVIDRNDPNAIETQLGIAGQIGRDLARVASGAPPDSEAAQAAALKEQEKYLVSVIQAKITDGNKRAALALYDKYPNVLKHNAGVDSVMKGVRTEIDGENAANSALTKVGLPPIRSGESGDLIQKRQDMTSRLQNAGFSAVVAPGIAANFEHESTFRSTANNPKDGADGSDSIGLGQWNGPRAKALIQFAKSKGVDPQSADAQIGYMKAELSGEVPFSVSGIKPDLKDRLDQAKTPGEAAALLSREYFKPRAATEANDRAATASSITPGNIYKGDLKAGYQQAAAEIQNNTSLSPEVRANALATLSKTSTQITSYQTAATAALKDEADSYRLRGYLSPTGPDPAKLASFADRAAALGNQSLADTYRLFASIAPSLKDGLQSLPADQFKLLKSLEEGPAKKLLEGIESGHADTLAQANDLFAKVKKAQADGLNVAGLKDMATQAAKLFADAGKTEKAREVAQTFATMTTAAGVLQASPVAQKQAMAELESIASTGQVNEEQAALHSQLKQGIATQAAEFDKDAYSAGRKLYGLPSLPITDGAGRMEQAARIASARGSGPIAPLTQDEFNALRTQADANPLKARELFASIAATYPPEAIPLIGAGLAGKEDTTDPVSRGYAAALNFYAEGQKDPSQKLIANEILDGVAKRREMGDALRNMPKSDTFYEAVQTSMGNAFRSLSGKVPAIIVNAAEAVYTSRIVRAGKQGEKTLDRDVFGAALNAVVGQTITREGQMLLPPKGVDAYQFDNALRQLESDNLVGLRTLNGSPVTADKIVRYGMLSNAGRDGLYFVEMADPARGGAPSYVEGPDGKPFTIDIKPLLERAKQFPRIDQPPRGALVKPGTTFLPGVIPEGAQ